MQNKANLQELFLLRARRERIPVTMFLMNGFQMRGIITGFDAFAVILDSEGRQQMIYKHAISTIAPSRPVDLSDERPGAERSPDRPYPDRPYPDRPYSDRPPQERYRRYPSDRPESYDAERAFAPRYPSDRDFTPRYPSERDASSRYSAGREYPGRYSPAADHDDRFTIEHPQETAESVPPVPDTNPANETAGHDDDDQPLTF